MNRFITFSALALLTGCATTHTLPEHALPDGKEYLKPIHVMIDDPLNAAQIRNQLRETGVFRSVESGRGNADDYSVWVRYNVQRDMPPFPVVLLSAATLFLLPLSVSIDTTTEFSLQHNGKQLKQYSYRNVTHKYSWLLDGPGGMELQSGHRVARAFAEDVQRDGLLPEEHAQ
ncbi:MULTISPECIES: hypothetical protein [Pseudomonas]|uniref:Lipoprotein n=1 Tax=Pseudomonas lactis TaxID=1615674 RepID=A0ABS9FN99_9PSED|nr:MULTISPECIES: hypothetical protein [Pseudomonas]MBI6977309.1 hypothetical protein [Pseudomonas lactis]MCF4974317.1 hypothetical protein [Pseudomonas lactis]MCF5002905.1 hypothetical protein [Pseudomonas lactis]MCF5007782.1 hypothetical protein [Pseudomonas lactis]MCF5013391.1 hypothetical protein [Pseudomonas lactis]